MSNVVNLNKFRKKKARAEQEKRADENRTRHGRPKAEKKKANLEQSIAKRTLDGHEREDDEG